MRTWVEGGVLERDESGVRPEDRAAAEGFSVLNKSQWQPALISEDTRRVPAADDLVDRSTAGSEAAAFAEGELICAVDVEYVADVEDRRAVVVTGEEAGLELADVVLRRNARLVKRPPQRVVEVERQPLRIALAQRDNQRVIVRDRGGSPDQQILRLQIRYRRPDASSKSNLGVYGDLLKRTDVPIDKVGCLRGRKSLSARDSRARNTAADHISVGDPESGAIQSILKVRLRRCRLVVAERPRNCVKSLRQGLA